VTDWYKGKAPDIGARETGDEPVRYGVDFEYQLPPEHRY
jgi:hypothetical protein